MVRRLDQGGHFVVSILHVFLSAVNVVAKLFDAHILRLDLGVEILSFVLSRLDYANNFVELVVLVLNHVFLDLKHLPVVKVSGLIKFIVLPSFIPLLFLLRGDRSLIIFN